MQISKPLVKMLNHFKSTGFYDAREIEISENDLLLVIVPGLYLYGSARIHETEGFPYFHGTHECRLCDITKKGTFVGWQKLKKNDVNFKLKDITSPFCNKDGSVIESKIYIFRKQLPAPFETDSQEYQSHMRVDPITGAKMITTELALMMDLYEI